ncbi:hypothetical protein GCM10020000_13510 [Streptomyces olivoverticillatus]
MGRNLFRTEPAFRAAVQRIDAEFSPLAGWSIADELFAADAADRVHQVAVAQPVLFAVQLGLAAVLRARGVEPDMVVGACFGEISAAAIAGILDTSDAIRLIHHYSQAQHRLAKPGRRNGGRGTAERPNSPNSSRSRSSSRPSTVPGRPGCPAMHPRWKPSSPS